MSEGFFGCVPHSRGPSLTRRVGTSTRMAGPAKINKWTAFLLSAFVPGAGQLAANSWTCLIWFIAAGLLAAGTIELTRLHGQAAWVWPLQAAWGIALCLLSAEHAKRLL